MNPFHGRHFQGEIILWAVRWYVTNRLRQGGYAPKLTDSEIITMEIVGEFLQMDTDSQIHQYFKQHWQTWFPQIGSYPNFAKQCVNLLQVKTLIQQHIVKQHGQDNIHFIDGFPIPVCQYARAYGIKPSNMKAVIVTVPQSNKNILALKDIYSLIYRA